MESKQHTHINLSFFANRKRLKLIVIAIVLLLAVMMGMFYFVQPERSVASFCRAAKIEKPVLTGDVSYDKQVESYKKLEAVAPEDIHSDITTIRKGYEDIVNNPSNTLSAGFGVAGAENRRNAYLHAHCTNF